MNTDKVGIHVSCGQEIIVMKEIQLEVKKRMDAAAFLRGYPIETGTMLKDHKE